MNEIQFRKELTQAADTIQALQEKLVDAVRQAEEARRRAEHAEQLVREREMRLDLAMGSARVGTWDWLIPKNTIVWDKYLHAVFGLPNGAFGGNYEAFEALVHPDERARVRREVVRAIEEDAVYDTEFQVVWPDGSIHLIEARGKVYRDPNGIPVQMTGVCWDGTDRRRAELAHQRAEEQIKINERRLNLVIDSAEMGCWDLDLTTNRAWRSPRHDRIFGYDALRSDWDFDIFLAHVVPEDRAQVTECMAAAMASGQFHMDCRIIWPDRSQHWITANGRVFRDDQGEPIRMVGVVALDDARKQLEQALIRQTEELKRSNTDLERFAYVASHDLQEPLRMVGSYLDLLALRYRDNLDDKARRWISYAVDGAVRMKQLIIDLLQFSRLGSQAKPPKPIDCAHVFAAAVANLLPTIQANDAMVTCDALPTVYADPNQLTLLFQNLFDNALKYRSEKRPEIRVESRRNTDHWVFSVRDNGIGIDPQFAERIFVIFQRLHTRAEYTGTGVGLALCKKIVERHGGRIWVESQSGNGATFFFTLPIQGVHSHEFAK